MLKLFELYLSFFKIGLFGFGGGYAMIPLIQKELEEHGWLKLKEFVNIIAIAEMTPGPIAINSGTFVGYKVSTIIGSLVATLGVITPSLIFILILAHYLSKFNQSPYVKEVIKFLKPTIIGLVVAAALTVGRTGVVDIPGLFISLSVVFLLVKTRVHPILIILLAGLSGIILYG